MFVGPNEHKSKLFLLAREEISVLNSLPAPSLPALEGGNLARVAYVSEGNVLVDSAGQRFQFSGF